MRRCMVTGASQPNSLSLWDAISKIASEEGVLLFDLDLPGGGEGGHAGILRVYITREKGSGEPSVVEPLNVETGDSDGDEAFPKRTGVSFEDCTRVCKRILDVDEQVGLIPEGCLLEVSSPGINRRLRRAEHFRGAVGERVRLKFREPSGSYRVATGLLSDVRGDTVSLQAEGQREMLRVGLNDIKDARVDFKF